MKWKCASPKPSKPLRFRSLESDIVLWNSLASAANDAGRWPQAHALLKQAPAANLPLTTVSLTTLAQRQWWEFSLLLLQTAEDLGAHAWQNALAIFGLLGKADAVAYSACINACGRGQQWQTALGLMQDLPDLYSP
eukprot:g3154.t1